jgi:hypothetical protein
MFFYWACFWSSMVSFFLWLITFYIFMAVAEYVIHRYSMHKRLFPKGWFDAVFEEHAILHHKHGRNDLNIDLPVRNHVLLSLPLIIALAIYAPVGLLAWSIIICYHSYLWTKAHRMIHGLEYNWMAKWGFYHDIREHHEKHHEHPNRNFGVCFFFVDRLMGTKI